MIKRPSLFATTLLISLSAFSSPTKLDCQTSSTFEKNLKDIEKVTKNSQECAEPNRGDIGQLCLEMNENESAGEESELNFKYQQTLWRISCANENSDSIEVARQKVQKMWTKYRTLISCKSPGVKVDGGNITKFSLETGFSIFLHDAIKDYKLDMNFKDPADGKTILDFVNEEIGLLKRPPIDRPAKLNDYQIIYQLLKTNGAKSGKEL